MPPAHAVVRDTIFSSAIFCFVAVVSCCFLLSQLVCSPSAMSDCGHERVAESLGGRRGGGRTGHVALGRVVGWKAAAAAVMGDWWLPPDRRWLQLPVRQRRHCSWPGSCCWLLHTYIATTPPLRCARWLKCRPTLHVQSVQIDGACCTAQIRLGYSITRTCA